MLDADKLLRRQSGLMAQMMANGTPPDIAQERACQQVQREIDAAGAVEFNPKLTVLSFSAGTGSSSLAEMILNGDYVVTGHPLLVLNADPGMENSHTYDYVASYRQRFEAAGIPFITVKRNLYQEIIDLKASGKTRFDTPPLWTRNRITGKKGRLKQGCTQAYKIAPMDRAMRAWMHDNLGISRVSRNLGHRIVRKLIGFSQDEWMRIKEAKQKYVYFEYPLVDRRMTKADLVGYFLKLGRPLPPRSVCNGCYANDVAYLRDMHDNRPADYEQACLVDEAVRDLRCIGVEDECFVSSTLIPLRELAARGFILPAKVVEQDAEACHSGHCFV